jgi:glycerophosphoryl diester phosphodiesterase
VRARGRELVLAHTIVDARRPGNVPLDEALDHLAAPRFADVGLNVDLKHLGCESAVLDALRERGLLHRTLVSCQVAAVVDRVRAFEPRVWTGISVGGRVARFSRRWRDWRAQVLDGLRSRRWETVMAQHGLVDAELLEDVIAHRGHLFAWTVNDRTAIDGLRRLGVHGITTADPRLFSADLSGPGQNSPAHC